MRFIFWRKPNYTFVWTKPDNVLNENAKRDFTFTITATGGNSVDFYVHIGYAAIVAWADQPYQEFRLLPNETFDPAKRALPVYPDNGYIGHASWEIVVAPSIIPYLKSGMSQGEKDMLDTYANQKWGFWLKGLLCDDDYNSGQNQHYSAKKSWTISAAGLMSVLSYTQAATTETYSYTTNNCVCKAIGAIQAAGIDFDCEKSSFTYDVPIFGPQVLTNVYAVGPFGEALVAAGGERL